MYAFSSLYRSVNCRSFTQQYLHSLPLNTCDELTAQIGECLWKAVLAYHLTLKADDFSTCIKPSHLLNCTPTFDVKIFSHISCNSL